MIIMIIKPKFLILLMILLFLPIVTAQQETLGFKKQNSCVDLIQNCANCTYVNFTAIYSPDMTLLATNLATTKFGSLFNYSFCNTSMLGTYIVNGIGDINTAPTVFAYTFDITPSGYEISIANGMIYSVLLIIIMILFIISLVGAFSLKANNEYDIGGGLLKINFNKYYKMGLFFLSYLLLIFITFFAWEITLNFLFLSFAAKAFEIINTILWIMLAPVFIGFVAAALIKWVLDLKLQDLANRNLKPYLGDKKW